MIIQKNCIEVALAVNKLYNITMRTAILISGQPRFTKEFDTFLENIKNYGTLDFFFYLWDATHKDSPQIPATWQTDLDYVKHKIESNLPPNSRIARLSINTPPEYIVPDYIQPNPWSKPKNVWYMYHAIKQVNSMREDFEKENGGYDLVIRTRPDIGFLKPVDATLIYNYLLSNSDSIIVPNNHRNGIGIPSINDMMAFGLRENMSTYARAFDYLDHYHVERNVSYHPETLLAYHLMCHDIKYPPNSLDIIIREYQTPWGSSEPTVVADHGRWL